MACAVHLCAVIQPRLKLCDTSFEVGYLSRRAVLPLLGGDCFQKLGSGKVGKIAAALVIAGLLKQVVFVRRKAEDYYPISYLAKRHRVRRGNRLRPTRPQ